jgi:hypothetical protein
MQSHRITNWLPFFRRRRASKALFARARGECQKEGWPWIEPIHSKPCGSNWLITTGCDDSARTVEILLSETGDVISKSFLPRIARLLAPKMKTQRPTAQAVGSALRRQPLQAG